MPNARLLRTALLTAAASGLAACSSSTAEPPRDQTLQAVQVGAVSAQLRFDAAMIDSASIVSDVLYLHVTHGGGCKTHTFGLHTSGVFLESYPVQVPAVLSHDADNDNCRALVRPVLRFDLADLRKAYLKAYKQPAPMILQIRAPGEGGVTTSVRYEIK